METPSLTLIVIKSSDMEALKCFYEKLGLKFRQEKHGSGPLHYSSILGDIVFEIYPLYKDENADKTRLGFRIANLNAAILKLTHEGVKIVSQPKQTPYGFRAVVKDTDGRTIELYQK